MMIGALLLWIPLIVLVFWGASRLFPALSVRPHDLSEETPLEILARRYARGDISRGEFEAIKDDIPSEDGGLER